MKISPLQRSFIDAFMDTPTISTREIYEWYCDHKTNPDVLPYRSSIHSLIVNPLLHKGLLTKISSGVYKITLPDEEEVIAAPQAQAKSKRVVEEVSSEDMTNEELTNDEAFERYIQQKLGG